ncbi:MAG: cupin domain-containing protein [Pseudomonadota bacterium]
MTDSHEYWTDERCFITEWVNDPRHPGASLARARVTPGTLTQNHALSVHEWYIIESGQGEMHLGGKPAFLVYAGDVVDIPAGTSQQIRNTGDIDLIFQCLCMPRFEPACYQSLEAQEPEHHE